MRNNIFQKEIPLPNKTAYKIKEKVTHQENTIKVFDFGFDFEVALEKFSPY